MCFLVTKTKIKVRKKTILRSKFKKISFINLITLMIKINIKNKVHKIKNYQNSNKKN